jgi:hypothetical protein
MPEFLHNEEANIAQFTVEPPKKPELLFDLDEVLDEQTWQKLTALAGDSRGVDNFVRFASTLITLRPERVTDLQLNDVLENKMREYLEYDLQGEIDRFFSERNYQTAEFANLETSNLRFTTLAQTKIVFPAIPLNEFYTQEILETATTLLDENDDKLARQEYYRNIAIALKILGLPQPIDFSREEIINQFKNDIGSIFTSGALAGTASKHCSDYKVLLGRHFDDAWITPEYWGKMREELQRYKTDPKYIHEALGMIYDMAILAAQRIEFTDRGLEIIKPKPLEPQAAPDLPKSRNF